MNDTSRSYSKLIAYFRDIETTNLALLASDDSDFLSEAEVISIEEELLQVNEFLTFLLAQYNKSKTQEKT